MQYQVISRHAMWLLSSRTNMETRCAINKPVSKKKMFKQQWWEWRPCLWSWRFSLESVMGLQPLSQMSLCKCWMVLAFDFYQLITSGNIISFIITKRLFFNCFLLFFFIITKTFLNEQNGILEIAAMGESKDLKRTKRLPLSQLCGLGGFICKMRRGKNEVNYSQVLFHLHYSSWIETICCLSMLTWCFLNIINCLDQRSIIKAHWKSMKVSFLDWCFKYLSELPPTSLTK